MNIEILAVGTRSPAWVADGYDEYQKRLPRDWKLSVQEINVSKRHKGEPAHKHREAEGTKMLSLIKKDSCIVAMDSRGQNWTTETLALNLNDWSTRFSQVQILIGGPDGLSDQCLKRANASWSLSKFTFPHFLVRVLLAEQIYRAWSILNKHPYHK